jgi:DNA-binding transcriptional LysR family regulator
MHLRNHKVLTLKQLKHLQAVQRHGSVHRAADVLHITQSALTRSLATLEEGLGVRLFDRSTSGMQPTEFCLRIQERCEQLLLEAEEIDREARLYRKLESGQLTLGLGRACRDLVLRAALPEFVRNHPQIKVQVNEGVPDELAYGLKSRQFDLIIAGSGSFAEIEGLTCQPLRTFNVPVFVRPDHPLAHRQGLTLAELTQFSMVATTDLSSAHPFRKKLAKMAQMQVHVLCNDYQALSEILLSTNAWTAAPEQQFAAELASGSLATLSIEQWNLTTELSAIELTGRSRSPAAQRFVELCQTNLP